MNVYNMIYVLLIMPRDFSVTSFEGLGCNTRVYFVELFIAGTPYVCRNPSLPSHRAYFTLAYVI